MFGFKSKREERLEKIEKIAELERKREKAGREYTAYMDEKRTDRSLDEREKKVKDDISSIKQAEFRAKTEKFRQYGDRIREAGTKLKGGFGSLEKGLKVSPIKGKRKATAKPQGLGIFGGYDAPSIGGSSFGSAPPLFSEPTKSRDRDFITGAPINTKRRLL